MGEIVPELRGGRDRTELFVGLFSANERRLRSYLFNLLPGADEVDEVMQEVSLVLWRKFDQFDPSTEFLKWAYVVARYEVLMFRRKKARDRHVFHEDLIEVLAVEYEEAEESLREERKALRVCLTKLGEGERSLLLGCYARGMKINQMAEKLGKTPTSLYKRVNRLRQVLSKCIERNVETV